MFKSILLSLMVSTSWIGENVRTVDKFESCLKYALSKDSLTLLEEDGFKTASVSLIDFTLLQVEENHAEIECVFFCHGYMIVYRCDLDLEMLKHKSNVYTAAVAFAQITYNNFHQSILLDRYNSPILLQRTRKKAPLL